MTRYIIRRILQAIPLLLFISFVVYGLIVLSPVDPLAICEHNPNITAAADCARKCSLVSRIAQNRAQNLDKSRTMCYNNDCE